jgi:hypothetical protein
VIDLGGLLHAHPEARWASWQRAREIYDKSAGDDSSDAKIIDLARRHAGD